MPDDFTFPGKSSKYVLEFNIMQTVYLRIILIRNQLEAQFFFHDTFIESSTCFEQPCAHTQEDNCMNTTSGTITLKISEWSKITKLTL